MSDLDSMALNLDRTNRTDGVESSKFVDLHEFIVDPESGFAYSQKNVKNVWN